MLFQIRESNTRERITVVIAVEYPFQKATHVTKAHIALTGGFIRCIFMCFAGMKRGIGKTRIGNAMIQVNLENG